VVVVVVLVLVVVVVVVVVAQYNILMPISKPSFNLKHKYGYSLFLHKYKIQNLDF